MSKISLFETFKGKSYIFHQVVIVQTFHNRLSASQGPSQSKNGAEDLFYNLVR